MTSTTETAAGFSDVPAELARALDADRAAREAARALISAASVRDLSEGALLELQHATVAARKEWDIMVATAAAEVGRRSAPEFGRKGLARKNGHTTPERFIAGITGGSRRDAKDLIKTGTTLGEAEKLRQDTEDAAAAGLPLPEPETPVYPLVASALASGMLSSAAAALITSMLDSARTDASVEQIRVAEKRLVEKAQGLSVEQLAPIVRRFQHTLQASVAERQQQEIHASRHVIITERKDGAVQINGLLDPVAAAPVRAALEGAVKDAFRARRDDQIAEDKRSAGQIRADALVAWAKHMLGCDKAPLSHATTRVEVRVDLEALRTGVGVAEIDGGGTIPAGQLRRMGVDAGYLPVILGGDSEPLDVGREERLFTSAQRVAFLERDGGCAMCGAPPSYCEAHHIEWWKDGGRSDLDNGLMLCVACHQTIHHGGWEIDATLTDVYFRPPGTVDPKRPWRLGGRARFGVTARERRELDGAAAPLDAPTPAAARPDGEPASNPESPGTGVPGAEPRSAMRPDSPGPLPATGKPSVRPRVATHTAGWLDTPPPDDHLMLL
ncbi:HNH endonuclease signature motif containing protein [uncultured Demequina sp.]|uniref:HNH endonuclease signature motif containing protein n=1 Tax=uncultured Demequina sp. TaxID=693499 RepID=UPI0025DE5F9A|nr:DUF222 domain-containing protein [uncultured Demequina sp.]